ncbi:MAG: SusC/RagA family TonB-linked outer membrane protein [Bacteroidetes bacterium HGW-Bacteroidetes-8]|nr:MAG: SusC/RagA family TonB-linked outer membrane protein [Bacteroidetes bacterium HGW-Bacteroidetes-8]
MKKFPVNRRIYKKLFLIMRLTMILMFFACIQISAKSYAQINLSATNEPLQKVFKEIQKQSGYDFLYLYDLLAKEGNVTIELKNATIKDAVDACIKGKNLSYTIVDNAVLIKAKEEAKQQQQQQVKYTLKGKVTEKNGTPVFGASVFVKGTTTGVATDEDGSYTLTLTNRNVTLVYSFIGFKTVELLYTGQPTINVVLEEEALVIEGAVATGMFTRKAESFTGSVQSFNREEIRKVGNSNVLQSIRNLDPSFRIVENLSNGSNPNQTYQITLRGQSGFPDLKGEYKNNPNEPLFIVDGFETSITYVMDMDMNRIANVTLLKDATAKAIYGSKAANGVVVIETLKPEAGRMKVSYTGSMNFQTPDLSSYNLCNAAEKLKVEKDGGLFLYFSDNGVQVSTNPGNQYLYDQYYNAILAEVLAGVNTDWKSLPLRNGMGQKHSVYLDGGDDYFRYGLDLSYNNVVGVMKGSGRNTFAGGISLSYRHKSISIRNSLTATYNKGVNSEYGTFSEYTRMNPYYRQKDELENYIKQPGINYGRSNDINPLYNTTINTKDFTEYMQFVNNFYIEWTPIERLKLTGRVGLVKKDNGAEVFHPASHTDFAGWESDTTLVNRRGRYTYGDGKDMSVSSDIIANYSFLVGKNHMFFANAGWSVNSAETEYVTFAAEGFPNDKLDNISFARQYMLNSRPSVSQGTTRDVGVLGSFNYSYASRYLFDASFRMSGSSQFGSNNRWGKFWSLGAGWNIHNEKFMKNLKDEGVVTLAKLRASVGFTGSQNFNSYQSLATYDYYTSQFYNGNIGAILGAMPNTNLKWQRKYDKNIGMDISLLKNRIALRFDYYIANTDDLLTDVTIPSSTGFTFYKENLGEVENKGYEFSIKYRVWNDPKNESFFNIFIAGAHNKNRIKQISNYLQTFNNTQTSTVSNKPVVRYNEGQSMTAIWAVPSYGIDPASGMELFIKPDGNRTYTWNSDYLAVCGDTEPTLLGNLGFNFDYKGLSVNLSAAYRFGGQLYNQTLVDKVENANLRQNVDRRIFESRWVNPGDVSLYKDIKNTATTRATSRFVEDDNVFGISSLNISYELNKLKKFKMKGVDRLKLSFDMADFAKLSSVRIERGTSYPFARTFSFSLQLMF